MLVARHTSLFRTTREAHEQLASSDFHVVMISVSALVLASVAYNDAENMLASVLVCMARRRHMCSVSALLLAY